MGVFAFLWLLRTLTFDISSKVCDNTTYTLYVHAALLSCHTYLLNTMSYGIPEILPKVPLFLGSDIFEGIQEFSNPHPPESHAEI